MKLTDGVMAASALGTLILALCVAILRTTVKSARRTVTLELHLEYAQKALAEHVETSAKTHQLLYETIKDDRAATNERLTFLERQRGNI